MSTAETDLAGSYEPAEPAEQAPETLQRVPPHSIEAETCVLASMILDANSIELEDLSSNGTFVDGKRIDRLVITDVKETPHEILLGAGDAFRLEWR